MKRPKGFDHKPTYKAQDSPVKATKPSKVTNANATKPTKLIPPTSLPRKPRSPVEERSGNLAPRQAAKRAARARRAYEREESRRFTRSTHRRRLGWLISGGLLLLVVGLVAVAIYSPLLSLKTIRIEGAARVNSASVHTALEQQLGRPLALIDFSSITHELGTFPLIRSFVTETVPPDTLIIRIVERVPIATLVTSSGFSVVDPAGIVIESAPDRQPGLPLIELGSGTKSSPAFVAAVGVLIALPPTLLAKVDTVTAQTSDDVTLTLAGGQSVIWGSPEQSGLKAKVLDAIIRVGGATTKYDVSAPNHPVLASN